jgi:hypothetical protein
MYTVSGPELVGAAGAAGVLGVLPRNNADSDSTFADWLARLEDDLSDRAHRQPNRRIAPVGVNLRVSMPADETDRHLALCAHHGVRIIVSAGGDPSELARRVHDHGLLLWHDITSLRFAEKAIAAGADGLTCIGAGGGGHSGTIGHLVLVPKIRTMFDGTIIMAGSVSPGGDPRGRDPRRRPRLPRHPLHRDPRVAGGGRVQAPHRRRHVRRSASHRPGRRRRRQLDGGVDALGRARSRQPARPHGVWTYVRPLAALGASLEDGVVGRPGYRPHRRRTAGG